MKLLSKKWWRKWLREIHRDLGYLAVGVTIVYAISGIILNHKKTKEDPAYKTVTIERTIERGIDVNSFELFWKQLDTGYELTRIFDHGEEYILYIKGGAGHYNPHTGELYFEFYKKKPVVYFINKLHYNQAKGWTGISDIFAGALIFLAVSGLFMVRGKKGIYGWRIIFLIGGIALVFLFVWL